LYHTISDLDNHNAQVRHTWANNVHKNETGRFIRARIALRKELGRKPTKKAVEEKIKAADALFSSTREVLRVELGRLPTKVEVKRKMGAFDYNFDTSVTVDEILRAYDTGEEVRKPQSFHHARLYA